MNPTKTQAINTFLKASTHSDLSNLYSHDMECQVVVAQDGGEPIQGEYLGRQWRGYSDGLQTWKPIRIPFNSMKDPHYDDTEMRWDLESHAEGIGMTGWDWKNKLSRWVTFDFDAIYGHSEKHQRKLSAEELDNIKNAIKDIPWVTLRHSTGGKGLHLYVFLEPFETQNHNEHAALARAILGKLSAHVGYDFGARVDVCGGNMWVWHRKMRNNENSLKIIKQGDKLSRDKIPPNWREHIPVISGKSGRVKPDFVKSKEVDELFEEVVGQSLHVELDGVHKSLIDYLSENEYYWVWDTDHHMLITHTWYLQKAHEELCMKGIFKTLAQGDDATTDYNCFCFPMRRGAWSVRRYSPGVEEASTWDQDGSGWTRCYLNKEADLSSASKINDGVEDTSGAFVFREGMFAGQAAKLLGVDIKIPTPASARKTQLKLHKDGRLVVSIDHVQEDDGGKFKGWLLKNKQWQKIFNTKVTTTVEPEVGSYDDIVRHCVTEQGDDNGWLIKSDSIWRNEPLPHVRVALEATGLNPNEVKQILGSSVMKCWTIVNMPFKPEYPGNRLWNRGAAQLRFQKKEVERPYHPNWDKILNHVGKGLEDAVKQNGWCVANGIISGADYLRCWVASIFQEPMQPLPYLFFYGPQNSGKSIFHEALNLLITSGYQRADNALVSSQGFNGELQNAIICVVEETDLNKSKQSYNRIKDWVTSKLMPIHTKNRTPYLIPNSSHWIHCSNDFNACPVFPGDSRITMCYVDSIDPIELIPKKKLMDLLEAEASDFITTILTLQLPPSNDRLNVPVVETDEKRSIVMLNRTALEQFLEERCHYVEGEKILFGSLYDVFMDWLDPKEQFDWSKVKFGRSLPPHFPKGRVAAEANKVYIGNISWNKKDPTRPKLVLRGENLVENN